jgi:alkylation response protein AidB-like acyl-CoA dehydrogenase
MDFDDTAEEAAWRAEVRAFLERHRDELGVRGDGKAAAQARQATLYDAGFVGVTWPVEAGGRGGTPMQQAIIDQEMARLGLPALINLIGIGMCGPTVIVHGSDDQKGRYLKRLLRADDVWCQLFSEPAAGSDLAGLRTRAVRDGDNDGDNDGGGWRVNGQKVWTTHAQLADYGILLTRTDPDVPKHRGLTMFVVDMHAPGVTVRPLRQMSGGADFNEVFFDDVVIPDAERLGDVGDGWRVALTTLMSERLSLGGGGTGIGPSIEAVARHVAEHLDALPPDRQVLARQELGRAYVAALGSRYTGYRQLSKVSRGEFPGPEASAGKLSGTRTARDLADLAVRVLGDDARVAKSRDGNGFWQDLQAGLPGMAIAGGTDQVLRNIIGERVLGLPAEPRADKGVTFKESLAATERTGA